MENRYSTIRPTEMSNQELASICMEIHTAINWGLNEIEVFDKSTNTIQVIPTSELRTYQKAFNTFVGGFSL